MPSPVELPEVTGAFTPEQKQYLEGFLAAVAAQVPFVGLTMQGQITASPETASVNLAAPAAPAEETIFGTPLSEVCKPERWKYDENPLDIWDKLVAHAEADKFPDEADTFRFKFHGLFYVAPAQDSFMIRLRIPAGELTSEQLRGLAEIAEWGGNYAHITTRANIQIRELKPRDVVKVLVRLQELGLTSRGAGADNIRNITASPNSGFDPDELIDVRPHAKGLHHYILNHRDLYALPRKFNVAFDNGGSISAAVDTNYIGFMAVSVSAAKLQKLPAGAPRVEPGVYFRVHLGGITGHLDFARDTGLLIKPSEAVAVAAAMIRVFAENGDRTNRKKARLKYLLDKWGFEKFVEETQKKLAFPLIRFPNEGCEPRKPLIKHSWVGAYKQSQRGQTSIGAGVPVGRMSPKQMRQIADIAANYGRGEIRLTVWQSLIIPHIPDPFVETAKRSIQRLGFSTDSSSAISGIIACTGSFGCKYGMADTKADALALAKVLSKHRVDPDYPINIHFTGCPNSCAQHYCGDLGFVGAKLGDGSSGYHLVMGGGMGNEQGAAREIFRGVRADELAPLVEKILATFSAEKNAGESFVSWSRRHSVKQLQEKFSS
jgi:ferredoxin-nitrite reductase